VSQIVLRSLQMMLRNRCGYNLADRRARYEEYIVIDLTPFKAEIDTICQELSLQQLDLIGSATREDFSAESDIDVLVTFAGDENLFERFFSLKRIFPPTQSVRSRLSS
jgi:hypothetical protein